jgi:glutathione S-transferase
LGETPAKLGFPDAGTGRYSRVLSYAAWLDFNNTQRAHLNLVEQLPLTITFFLASLLLLPEYVKYMIWVYVGGRVLYTIGYKMGGAGLRMPGAMFATPQTHLMTLAFPPLLCYKVA